MAPLYDANSRLQVPSMTLPYTFYSSPTLSSSTSDLESGTASLSAQALYAQSFHRPSSSRSLPPGRFRKNMKDITGYTTTEDEFEALPIAVRRKYFSTLERLRFAQNSRSNAINDLPIQRNRKGSLADRRGVTVPVIEPQRKSPSSRRLRKFTRQQSISSDEVSWFLTLPEKIQKKQFTREEQVVLAGQLRESVILDAADEAIYKASRRASRNLTPLFDPPTTPSMSRDSTESYRSDAETSIMTAAMYESFRWMDEEKDLDLRLVLDDYHANLDGVVIPTPNSIRRPSFRRQMSISKMPFGRNSFSSLQARSPRSPRFETNHSRNKSKTLSLIAPKYGHIVHDSVSSIDPNATHYQDPEARLKLRVYLASPQKFDEAIEFGFPSKDAVAEDKENKPPRISRDVLTRTSHSTDKGRSFLLNDIDTASLFDDDASMMEPDSPLTPMERDTAFRSHSQLTPPSGSKESKTSVDFSHLGISKPTLVKQQESYTQAMAGSREMTLRMTLTRPDLRADEKTLYGWQTSKSPLREEPLIGDDVEDSEVRGPYGGADGWGPADKDNGVVKRFWNKVKSGQRKAV